MINLLSNQHKKDIRAARLNVKLLNYGLLFGSVMLFMFGIFAVGYVMNQGQEGDAKSRKNQAESQLASYATTKAEAESFAANLDLANKILGNETTYSDLIFKVTHALPSGAILSELILNNSSFGATLTLNAKIKNYSTVLKMKETLEDSPLFSNVKIVNINDSDNGNYPLTAAYSVDLLSKDELIKLQKASS